jgi:hypothetical protein
MRLGSLFLPIVKGGWWLKKIANVLLFVGPVSSDHGSLENRTLCIVCLKFWFSIHILPKTYRKKLRHLDKLINDIKKSKKRTKNPKLSQNKKKNFSLAQICFFRQFEGEKKYLKWISPHQIEHIDIKINHIGGWNWC